MMKIMPFVGFHHRELGGFFVRRRLHQCSRVRWTAGRLGYGVTAEAIQNPILCSPFQPPDRHFVLGPAGPTGEIRDGRRPSESFFVRHCYFTGGDDPYDRLKRTLKAEINAEAWETLYRTESRPFPTPVSGRIAVKVINDYGDEVMKVFDLA